MPNYYEILKVPTSATTDEIEAACDAYYHQWRRLVTHHDSNVVNQANQALQALETIRATLTDREKRAVYDAAIGLSNNIGGLADPAALLQSIEPIPVPPAPERKPESDEISPNFKVWVCPKCQTHNEPGVQYCAKCGTQIGKDCPKCGQRIQVNAEHCVHCGVNIAAYIEQQELEKAARERQAQAADRQQVEATARAEAEEQAKKRRKRIGCGLGCLVLVFLIAIGGSGTLSLITNPPFLQILEQQESQGATIPTWKGDSLHVSAQLDSIYDDSYTLQYEILNASGQNYLISFLTSDIEVRDDLGGLYKDESSTEPLQYTLQADERRTFYRSYEGMVDPLATELKVTIAHIGEEQNIEINIPITVSPDQLDVDFALDPSNGSFSIQGTIQNLGQNQAFIRFEAADIQVTDDLGNQYSMEAYHQDDQYMRRLEPTENYGDSRSYQWSFVPGVLPEANSINVELANLMGKAFNATLSLGSIDRDVRYEATWREGWSNSFYIDFAVFNLGSENLVVRFDKHPLTAQGASGQVFSSEESDDRIGEVVYPGRSRSYRLTFEGTPTGELTLIIPIFCGEENIRIPVQPED